VTDEVLEGFFPASIAVSCHEAASLEPQKRLLTQFCKYTLKLLQVRVAHPSAQEGIRHSLLGQGEADSALADGEGQ
jgi:hypothetical protein